MEQREPREDLMHDLPTAKARRLAKHFIAGSPAVKQAIAPILTQHVTDRKKEGFKPFEITPDEHVTKLRQGMSDYSDDIESRNQPVWDIAKDTLAPEETYMEGIIIREISRRWERPSDEVADGYEFMREDFAREYLGMHGELGTKQVFDQLKEETDRGVEAQDMTYKLRKRGLKDALAKGSATKWAGGFKEFMGEQTLKYGDREGMTAHYEKVYRDGFKLMRTKHASKRKLAITVIGELRKPEGQIVEGPVAPQLTPETLEKIGKLSKEDRGILMHIIHGEAEQGEVDTSTLEDISTQFVRSFTNLFGEEGNINLGGKERSVAQAMAALENDAPIFLTRAQKDGEDILSLLPPWGPLTGDLLGVRARATSAQRAEIKKRFETFPQEMEIIRDIRATFQTGINPSTPGDGVLGWGMEKMILPAINQAGFMASALYPPYMYVAQADMATQQFRDAGYSWDESMQLGNTAAVGQSMIEMVQAGTLMGGGTLFKAAAFSFKRLAGHVGANYGFQVGQEYIQEAVPILVSAMRESIKEGTGEEVPEATGKLFEGFKKSLLPIAQTMAPIGFIGGGVASFREFKHGAELYLQEMSKLEAILPLDIAHDIATLAKKDPEAAQTKLREHFDRGDLMAEPNYTKVTERRDEAKAEMARLGVEVTQNSDGTYAVAYQRDGEPVTDTGLTEDGARDIWQEVWAEDQEKTATATVDLVTEKTKELPFVTVKTLTGKGAVSEVSASKDGKITVKIATKALKGKKTSATFNVDEETTHMLEMLGAREEWMALGADTRPANFLDFLQGRAKQRANAIDAKIAKLPEAERQSVVESLVASVKAYRPNADTSALDQLARGGAKSEAKSPIEPGQERPEHQLRYSQGTEYEAVTLIMTDPRLKELITMGSRIKKAMGGQKNPPKLNIDLDRRRMLEEELGVNATDAYNASKDMAKAARKSDEAVTVNVDSILKTPVESKADATEKAPELGTVGSIMQEAAKIGKEGSETAIYSEWLRQLDQLKRTGKVTELFNNVKDAIKKVIEKAVALVERGRAVVEKVEPIKGDLKAIQAQRDKLGLPGLSKEGVAGAKQGPKTDAGAKQGPKTAKEEYGPKTDAKEGSAAEAKEGPKTDAKEGSAAEAKEGPKTDAEQGPKTDAEGKATPFKGPTAPDISHLLSRGYTGPANAIMDAQRADMGLEPLGPQIGKVIGEEEYAKAEIANADRKAGKKLVDELLVQSKALQTPELFILAHEQAHREHENREAAQAIIENDRPGQLPFLAAQQEATEVEVQDVHTALHRAKGDNARVMRFMQTIVDDSMSVASLTQHWVSFANHGLSLSKEEVGFIKLFAANMAEARENTKKAIAALKKERKKESAERKKAREQVTAKLTGDYETDRLAAEAATAAANTDDEIMAALFIEDKLRTDYKNAELAKNKTSRTKLEKLTDLPVEANLLFHKLMTMWDDSGLFRQGVATFMKHPRIGLESIMPSFKAAISREGAWKMMQVIYTDYMYPELKAGGLKINRGDTMSRENNDAAVHEELMGRWGDRAPGYVQSARAFIVMMNYIRYFAAKKIALGNIRRLAKKGDTSMESTYKGASYMVNVATGVAGPKLTESSSKKLMLGVFSPALQISRLKWIAMPLGIARSPSEVRLMMAQEWSLSIASSVTVLTLAELGMNTFRDEEDKKPLSIDFRHPDFLKLKFGNTRLDVLGGVAQYYVLAGRMWRGETIDSKTGKVRDASRPEVLGRFLRNKLSPILGATWNLVEGTDPTGAPTGPLDFADFPVITALTGVQAPAAISSLLHPMSLSEIPEILEEDHSMSAKTALSIAAFFGASTSTYDVNEPRPEDKGGLPEVLDEMGIWGATKEFFSEAGDQLKKAGHTRENIAGILNSMKVGLLQQTPPEVDLEK